MNSLNFAVSGSPVIRSPTITLAPLQPEQVQMSLDRQRLASLQNGGGDSTDSSSEDDDLFEKLRM